jgi:hypothetical protein
MSEMAEAPCRDISGDRLIKAARRVVLARRTWRYTGEAAGGRELVAAINELEAIVGRPKDEKDI